MLFLFCHKLYSLVKYVILIYDSGVCDEEEKGSKKTYKKAFNHSNCFTKYFSCFRYLRKIYL